MGDVISKLTELREWFVHKNMNLSACAMDETVEHIQHLEQRLAEVEVKKTDLILLAKAAKDYINKSPCDPDIFPEQWEAYVVYKQLLEKTNEV